MERYTIRDYNEYLKMESGMYPYETPLWVTNRLDESKGIVDDYLPIIDELYDALISNDPIPFNNETSYLCYTALGYKFKQKELFMASCDIVVFTGVLGNSFFLGKDVGILEDSMKMINGKFTIRIENKFLDSDEGKNEFYELMAHELQHAYRFYNIFLSNNSYNDEEKKKNERDITAYNMQKYANSTIERDVSIIYYLSERNEISSESNKLYEYIRNHQEINEGNFEEYFNENLPLYPMKMSLGNFLEEVDSKTDLENTGYIKKVGETFKKIIGDKKMTPSRAFIKFRARVADAYMFASRLFNRTLVKAFNDFDRKIEATPNGSTLAVEMIETQKDFNLLREILNKH